MRPPSFFDRTPTIKTHEEMMARLEERSRSPIKKEPENKVVTSLEWMPRNIGENKILTTDGRYSIDATKVNGIWYYNAWRRSPRGHLGSADYADAAKKLCEDDLLTQA